MFDSARTVRVASAARGGGRWAPAPRGTASVGLILEYGRGLGVGAERLLSGSGISRAQLVDPAAEIEAAQELAVLANLAAETGAPAGLGLGLGQRYGLHTYGIFGFAVLASATLADAIAVAERFRELAYALVDVHTVSAGDHVEVRLDAGHLPGRLRRLVIERDAAAIALMQRELFAEPVPLAGVSFHFPAPAPEAPDGLAAYRRAFGVLPRFEAGHDGLSISAALLARPLPRASELAAGQCRALCEQLLDRRQRRRGLAVRVRAELLGDVREMPGQDRVAGALGVSVRTLRRRLAAEGTSFRAIVTETRMLLAEELLAAGGLTVEQVAERLGYAEASSFVHAFTRWQGISPARWAGRRGAAPGSAGDTRPGARQGPRGGR